MMVFNYRVGEGTYIEPRNFVMGLNRRILIDMEFPSSRRSNLGAGRICLNTQLFFTVIMVLAATLCRNRLLGMLKSLRQR